MTAVLQAGQIRNQAIKKRKKRVKYKETSFMKRKIRVIKSMQTSTLSFGRAIGAVTGQLQSRWAGWNVSGAEVRREGLCWESRR